MEVDSLDSQCLFAFRFILGPRIYIKLQCLDNNNKCIHGNYLSSRLWCRFSTQLMNSIIELIGCVRKREKMLYASATATAISLEM